MFYRYSVTKVGNFFLKNRTFNALYRLQWTRPGGHGSGVKIGLYPASGVKLMPSMYTDHTATISFSNKCDDLASLITTLRCGLSR